MALTYGHKRSELWGARWKSINFSEDKIREICFNDLRHSHASLLVEMGFSPFLISERLGHEDIKTTLQISSHHLLYGSKQSKSKIGFCYQSAIK